MIVSFIVSRVPHYLGYNMLLNKNPPRPSQDIVYYAMCTPSGPLIRITFASFQIYHQSDSAIQRYFMAKRPLFSNEGQVLANRPEISSRHHEKCRQRHRKAASELEPHASSFRLCDAMADRQQRIRVLQRGRGRRCCHQQCRSDRQ